MPNGLRPRPLSLQSASVALFLGIVGIYGVIAYVAAQRTREIGIRIALGAQIGEVRKMFLRRGLWLTAGGIALGISAVLAATQVLSTLLFGVSPVDPMTCVGCQRFSEWWRCWRFICRRTVHHAWILSPPYEPTAVSAWPSSTARCRGPSTLRLSQ